MIEFLAVRVSVLSPDKAIAQARRCGSAGAYKVEAMRLHFGREQWAVISSHHSAEVAEKAASRFAKKHNLTN